MANAKNKKEAPEVVEFTGKETLNVSWTNELTEQVVSKTIRFKSPSVRLKNSAVVDSDMLIKVAKGHKLSEEEQDAHLGLVGLSKEDAIQWLTDLTQMKYGLLEIEDGPKK
jgi:hypothetical protein